MAATCTIRETVRVVKTAACVCHNSTWSAAPASVSQLFFTWNVESTFLTISVVLLLFFLLFFNFLPLFFNRLLLFSPLTYSTFFSSQYFSMVFLHAAEDGNYTLLVRWEITDRLSDFLPVVVFGRGEVPAFTICCILSTISGFISPNIPIFYIQ